MLWKITIFEKKICVIIYGQNNLYFDDLINFVVFYCSYPAGRFFVFSAFAVKSSKLYKLLQKL